LERMGKSQASKKKRKRRTGSFAHNKECITGKAGYDTWEAAAFFGRADGLRPYPCNHCDRYHLSSKPKRKVA